MSSFFELLSELQDTLDNIMQPVSTSFRVVTRPRSQTLPANFAPSAFSTKILPSSILISANDDGKIQPELLGSLLDYFGFDAVHKFLIGFLQLDKYGLGYLGITNGKKKIHGSNIPGKTLRIQNEADFSLFNLFPKEVKIKIFTYAFEAPRIVSVSYKQLKHNPSCHGHTRLVYSGPQNPHLCVNYLTRSLAAPKLHIFYQTCGVHVGCKAFPEVQYNPVSETIWIREIDFWLLSNEYSCSFALSYQNRAVRRLAITTSSIKVVMDKENLYRLSCILSRYFRGLQELIVIVDELDFTTPGFPDEIVFVSRNSKMLPKRPVIAKYTPDASSLSEELLIGLVYGEWKPAHWISLVSSLTESLRSKIMKRKEAERIIAVPIKTKISAAKLHAGLRDWKSRIEVMHDNGDEARCKAIKKFSTWSIPTVKLLAAVTRNHFERKNGN